MRWRDPEGRPVPPGTAGARPPEPEVTLPPAEALRVARSLLAGGRAFEAHEVFEQVWRATGRRALYRGLAQVCVAVTHWQRGNGVGAVRLLRRAAGSLAEDPGDTYPSAGLAARCLALATRLSAGPASPPGAAELVRALDL